MSSCDRQGGTANTGPPTRDRQHGTANTGPPTMEKRARAHWGLAFMLLFAALAGCRARGGTRALQAGAYYYSWYGPERWHRPDGATTDMPVLGSYESGDRTIARRHVEWAKQAALDFLMASWLGPSSPEDRNFGDAVLPEIE